MTDYEIRTLLASYADMRSAMEKGFLSLDEILGTDDPMQQTDIVVRAHEAMTAMREFLPVTALPSLSPQGDQT